MADHMGQQFGTYQLTSLLAETAITEVYHGEQRYSHIDVAIKLLRHPFATSEAIDAFRGEARALAALIHPHIVRIQSFDVQNQIGFLVMDFAPGGSLRQRHPSGELVPLETIVGYTKQAADALQSIHDQRIVHQDLKPESLLVGHQDEILLAGFYLASAYPPADAQPPEEGRVVTAYLAPEQLQGKAYPASDQYSLGIIVYEWLSGALPFQGAGAELAQHILKSAPPTLQQGTLAVSPVIERVVMRALAKDPAKRFASVQAFASALEEAAASVPQGAVAATPHPAPKQPVAAQAARGSSPQAAAAQARVPTAQSAGRTPQHGPAQPSNERFGPPTQQTAWQGQPMPARAPAPPQPRPGQPAPYQTPYQQSNWQRPNPQPRSFNAANIGCIVTVIVIAFIAIIYILANH